MRTPVIIPAFNEERHIGRTLEVLPANLVEPIVVVNGSTDRTAEIASAFGAEVHIMKEQGKMPAIQRVLHRLGERALDPLLILDADTRPIFPTKWPSSMLKNVTVGDEPQVVGGPLWSTEGPGGALILRSLRRLSKAMKSPNNQSTEQAVQLGANVAFKIKTQQTLDKIMELPNYWPGEDRAMIQTVLDHEGTYYQSVHPYAFAFTPLSVSAISLRDRARLGPDEARRIVQQRYADRGAPGSTPYRPELKDPANQ